VQKSTVSDWEKNISKSETGIAYIPEVKDLRVSTQLL
jgi:hypothetical protein